MPGLGFLELLEELGVAGGEAEGERVYLGLGDCELLAQR